VAPLIPFTPEWRAARARKRSAKAYVATILADPSAADAEWLAGAAAAGDVDHARWELRYVRMAVGIFVAERDALDDRTASEIANALRAEFAADARVAPDLRPLADQQFADRVHAYRDAFFARGTTGATERLGRVLLAFASDGARSAGGPLARATEILAGYVVEANTALVAAYGSASLPDHLPPSEAVAKR
jgi:hypothetical protein